MEDLMKRPVSNQQSDLDDAEFANDSRRPEVPPFSSKSRAGTSDSSSNLDPASTRAGDYSQASDFGLPPPEGQCESAMHFSGLIVVSIPHCSR